MRIIIITPVRSSSRSGNGTTTARWTRILRELGHEVQVANRYDGAAADLMIALHAWRSADSIRRFSRALPGSAADRGVERHRHLRLYRSRSCADFAFARLRRPAGRAAGACAPARAGAISAQGSRAAPVGSAAASCASPGDAHASTWR